jgi:hypothetical protein
VILLKGEVGMQYSTTGVSMTERDWIKVDMKKYLGQFLIKLSKGTFEFLA